MKKCGFCGYGNEDSAVFCSFCGNKFVEEIAKKPRASQEQQSFDGGETMPETEPEVSYDDEASVFSKETDSQKDSGDETSSKGSQDSHGGGTEDSDQRDIDEAMITQEPAFAGQRPVNEQFGETAPGGQFTESEQNYRRGSDSAFHNVSSDRDVGRGQTYADRQQQETRGSYSGGRSERDSAYMETPHEVGGSYQDSLPQTERRGRPGRRIASGSKTFMIYSRKRVRSVMFFLMTLSFSLMLVLNAWNIYSGNAMVNIEEAKDSLDKIIESSDTNLFVQMVSELGLKITTTITNISDIVEALGDIVKLSIAIVILLPNSLYALGLWIMFSQTDIRRRLFSTSGYTLARVMMILKFLIACLVLALGLVISVYYVVVGTQGATISFDSTLFEGLIFLVFMIVLSILVVMYYIQWIYCLKVVKVDSSIGSHGGRMPVFIVVLSLICFAACVCLMIPMAPNDYYGLASRGAAAAYFLFSGLWILIYRVRVKRN